MQSQKSMDGMSFELMFRTDPLNCQLISRSNEKHVTHRLPRDACMTPLTTTNHQAIGGVLTTPKAAANFVKHSEVRWLHNLQSCLHSLSADLVSTEQLDDAFERVVGRRVVQHKGFAATIVKSTLTV